MQVRGRPNGPERSAKGYRNGVAAYGIEDPVRNASKHAQTDAYTQIKDPTGSGPFKMVMREWQPGHGSLR